LVLGLLDLQSEATSPNQIAVDFASNVTPVCPQRDAAGNCTVTDSIYYKVITQFLGGTTCSSEASCLATQLDLLAQGKTPGLKSRSDYLWDILNAARNWNSSGGWAGDGNLAFYLYNDVRNISADNCASVQLRTFATLNDAAGQGFTDTSLWPSGWAASNRIMISKKDCTSLVWYEGTIAPEVDTNAWQDNDAWLGATNVASVESIRATVTSKLNADLNGGAGLIPSFTSTMTSRAVTHLGRGLQQQPGLADRKERPLFQTILAERDAHDHCQRRQLRHELQRQP